MNFKNKVLVVLLAVLITFLPFVSVKSYAFSPSETYTITVKAAGHGSDTEVTVSASGSPVYFGDIAYTIPDPDEVEGYYCMEYAGFSTKPISEYSTYSALMSDIRSLYDTEISSDMTVYRIWFTVITEARINVVPPKCGESTSVDENNISVESGEVYGWEDQTNKPVISFENEDMFKESGYDTCWTDETEYSYYPWYPYSGDFIAGGEYGVGIADLESKFPYVMTVDTVFYINGKRVEDDDKYIWTNDSRYEDFLSIAPMISGTVTGEHDWLEWETIEEPTEEEAGLQRRVCSAYPDTHFEEEPIDPLGMPVEKHYFFVEDAGATYVLGSDSPLNFVVKADIDDEYTFRLFKGIEIDNDAVDEADYDAEGGCVKLSLHPDYLDNLAEGTHSIKALFEDGDAKTEFVVTRNNEPDPDGDENADEDIDDINDGDDGEPADTADDTSSNAVSTLPTGDGFSSMLLFFSIVFAVAFCAAAVKGKKYVAKYMRK